MASSALFSALILGILIALKCDFSSAYALEGADSGSNPASLLYQIIEDLYGLQNENKLMREKIEMLKEKLELQETSAMGQAEKIEILEEKLESGLKSLESELDTSTEGKSKGIHTSYETRF